MKNLLNIIAVLLIGFSFFLGISERNIFMTYCKPVDYLVSWIVFLVGMFILILGKKND